MIIMTGLILCSISEFSQWPCMRWLLSVMLNTEMPSIPCGIRTSTSSQMIWKSLQLLMHLPTPLNRQSSRLSTWLSMVTKSIQADHPSTTTLSSESQLVSLPPISSSPLTTGLDPTSSQDLTHGLSTTLRFDKVRH